MRVYLIALLLVLSSCGSRKVDLRKRIADVEYNLSIKTKELEIERKKLRVYESSRVIKADSIVEENSKRTIYNPSTEEKTTEKEHSSETEKTKEEDKKENAKDNSSEVDKKVDRKQFNWWGVGISIGVLVVLIYFISKYWKKLFKLPLK